MRGVDTHPLCCLHSLVILLFSFPVPHFTATNWFLSFRSSGIKSLLLPAISFPHSCTIGPPFFLTSTFSTCCTTILICLSSLITLVLSFFPSDPNPIIYSFFLLFSLEELTHAHNFSCSSVKMIPTCPFYHGLPLFTKWNFVMFNDC